MLAAFRHVGDQRVDNHVAGAGVESDDFFGLRARRG